MFTFIGEDPPGVYQSSQDNDVIMEDNSSYVDGHYLLHNLITLQVGTVYQWVSPGLLTQALIMWKRCAFITEVLYAHCPSGYLKEDFIKTITDKGSCTALEDFTLEWTMDTCMTVLNNLSAQQVSCRLNYSLANS